MYKNITLREKRRLGQTLSVNGAHYDMIIKKKTENIQKQPSQDTSIRVELQELIRKRLDQGCTKEQILAVLKVEPKFAKFSVFFESYIDNYLKKYNRER